MSEYLLSIDAGTTSIRAIVFDALGRAVATAQQEFMQHYPRPGWVEQDADEIWATTLAVVRRVFAEAALDATRIIAVGITNQRETTVLWERDSGRPVHRAIVWQDRRTADVCERLRAAGHEDRVAAKTGLLLDPYFSATKIAWTLDQVPDARARAAGGELCFGTIDTWLLWKLTGGRTFATDATNASRTLLFDLRTQQWDEALCALFDVPRALLPEVRDSNGDFGVVDRAWFGAAMPIRGVLGDQQAALVGQACFAPGMIKSTYGTGCFIVMNTGGEIARSRNRLLSTVAYRIDGVTTYAIEGSIFVAGAAIQWLRDGLKLIDSAAQSEAIARGARGSNGVYLVPAFTGLGAPHWDPHARGAILGLTRDTGIAEIVTAGLQSVCFQTRDLLDAMQRDGAAAACTLRIDGGMAANDWFAQSLADLLGVPVDRPNGIETTALGAACMAGLGIGLYDSLERIATQWGCERRFEVQMPAPERDALYRGWGEAVRRVLAPSPPGNAASHPA
ncbi:MAG: glycerol kinase GlpK [Rhodanobacteraceae bacterium]|nr:glycerol kinase GlpK [Rhodanobacteraceae bacterium]MBP7624680.1 glycerol kinase GlpK [Xanthomonadales bacterium]